MHLKRRVAKIETSIHPKRYAVLEDILRILDLKKQKSLTEQDRQRLEELQKLEVHPDLIATLRKNNHGR